MRRVMVLAGISAMCCSCAFAQAKVYSGQKLKQMTPKEEREWLARRASNVAIQRFPDSARLAVVIGTEKLPVGVVESCAMVIADRIGIELPVQSRLKAFNPAEVPADVASLSVRGAIYVVDAPGWPISLIAPEGGWAMLNISALVADHPSADVLERRIRRGLWRCFAFAFGAGDAMFDGCVTKPVSSLSELDALPSDDISPGLDDRIVKHLKRIGVKPARRTTYKRACQEGWAPAPTNEYQKAIWDKVHEMPIEPIKIKPETKKVTE